MRRPKTRVEQGASGDEEAPGETGRSSRVQGSRPTVALPYRDPACGLFVPPRISGRVDVDDEHVIGRPEQFEQCTFDPRGFRPPEGQSGRDHQSGEVASIGARPSAACFRCPIRVIWLREPNRFSRVHVGRLCHFAELIHCPRPCPPPSTISAITSPPSKT